MIIVALCQGVVKFKGMMCVNCGIYRHKLPSTPKGLLSDHKKYF